MVRYWTAESDGVAVCLCHSCRGETHQHGLDAGTLCLAGAGCARPVLVSGKNFEQCVAFY